MEQNKKKKRAFLSYLLPNEQGKSILKKWFSLIIDKIGIFLKATIGKPLYLMVHPIGGWDSFKREKEAERWVSIYYFILMMIVVILNQTIRGFIVGETDLTKFKLLKTLLTVILPVLGFTIASWSIGSLFDGKGKIGEIFDAVCYSFAPFVWIGLIATIISNFITLDEVTIYYFMMGLATALMIWMLFFGLMGIHQNNLGMNIIQIIFTIVAVCILVFVVLLFFSFIERIIGWFSSIINELKMRYF